MDKLAVQSRYTRINDWYRAPHAIRFSNHLIRQMMKSGQESSNNPRAPLRVATALNLIPGRDR
jgi:hypothetical protein